MADLVTINQYKAFRGIVGNTEDAKLNVIVPSVSNLVKTYCGRTFLDYYSTNKTEYFSLKWKQNTVFLSETPIVTVSTVEELQESTVSTYITLTASQYVIDNNLNAIYRVDTDGTRYDFPVGINSVRVVYRGGYSALPSDLRLAVSDLITYYLKEEHKPEKNHTSFTITNPTGKADFPEHIKRVLDLYKDG